MKFSSILALLESCKPNLIKWHNWSDMQAPVLRIEALIAMKQATGRPQDLADAALLRDILKQQRDADRT